MNGLLHNAGRRNRRTQKKPSTSTPTGKLDIPNRSGIIGHVLGNGSVVASLPVSWVSRFHQPRPQLTPCGWMDVSELLLLNVHGGEKASQGRGRVVKGGQRSETSRQAPTRKTKAAVDRRQKNRMLRQCRVRPALSSDHSTT